jgi:hypothetical protein
LIRISGFPLYNSIRPVILTRFPSRPERIGDFRDWGSVRYPAGKSLVRVGSSDVEERVSAFGSEHLRNRAFHCRPFVDVGRCFVGWNDSGGLGVTAREERTTNDEERKAARELAHAFSESEAHTCGTGPNVQLDRKSIMTRRESIPCFLQASSSFLSARFTRCWYSANPGGG